MGTRGGYGFIKDGRKKITYCHYDSYPEWLGKNVVNFVMDTPVSELNEIFDRILMVAEGFKPSDEQIAECKKYANTSVSTKSFNDWYVLLRETQGDLFPYKNGLKYMIMNGSLNLEYGYVIDLDQNAFLYYRNGRLVNSVPLEIADEIFD